ncbi:26045_t:CDS:2, partial [Racocetra persica]
IEGKKNKGSEEQIDGYLCVKEARGKNKGDKSNDDPFIRGFIYPFQRTILSPHIDNLK